MFLRRDRYGSVTCTWCDLTVSRMNSSQVTCGKLGCMEKQNAATARIRATRKAERDNRIRNK